MDYDLVCTQAMPEVWNEDSDISTQTAVAGTRKKVGVLKVLSSVRKAEEHEFSIFSGQNIIGRHSTCDISIPWGATLSKKHAIIEAENEICFLSDCGSSNKTRFGKVQLKPDIKYGLRDGDEITFGNVKCTFHQTSQDDDSILATPTCSADVLAMETPDMVPNPRHVFPTMTIPDSPCEHAEPRRSVDSEVMPLNDNTEVNETDVSHISDSNGDDANYHMESDTDIEDNNENIARTDENDLSEDDIYHASTLPLENTSTSQETESSQYEEEMNDGDDDEISMIADLAAEESQGFIAKQKYSENIEKLNIATTDSGETSPKQNDALLNATEEIPINENDVPGCSGINLHNPVSELLDDTYEEDSLGDLCTQAFVMPKKSALWEDSLGLLETQPMGLPSKKETDPMIEEDSDTDVDDSICDMQTQAFPAYVIRPNDSLNMTKDLASSPNDMPILGVSVTQDMNDSTVLEGDSDSAVQNQPGEVQPGGSNSPVEKWDQLSNLTSAGSKSSHQSSSGYPNLNSPLFVGVQQPHSPGNINDVDAMSTKNISKPSSIQQCEKHPDKVGSNENVISTICSENATVASKDEENETYCDTTSEDGDTLPLVSTLDTFSDEIKSGFSMNASTASKCVGIESCSDDTRLLENAVPAAADEPIQDDETPPLQRTNKVIVPLEQYFTKDQEETAEEDESTQSYCLNIGEEHPPTDSKESVGVETSEVLCGSSFSADYENKNLRENNRFVTDNTVAKTENIIAMETDHEIEAESSETSSEAVENITHHNITEDQGTANSSEAILADASECVSDDDATQEYDLPSINEMSSTIHASGIDTSMCESNTDVAIPGMDPEISKSSELQDVRNATNKPTVSHTSNDETVMSNPDTDVSTGTIEDGPSSTRTECVKEKLQQPLENDTQAPVTDENCNLIKICEPSKNILIPNVAANNKITITHVGMNKETPIVENVTIDEDFGDTQPYCIPVTRQVAVTTVFDVSDQKEDKDVIICDDKFAPTQSYVKSPNPLLCNYHSRAIGHSSSTITPQEPNFESSVNAKVRSNIASGDSGCLDNEASTQSYVKFQAPKPTQSDEVINSFSPAVEKSTPKSSRTGNDPLPQMTNSTTVSDNMQEYELMETQRYNGTTHSNVVKTPTAIVVSKKDDCQSNSPVWTTDSIVNISMQTRSTRRSTRKDYAKMANGEPAEENGTSEGLSKRDETPKRKRGQRSKNTRNSNTASKSATESPVKDDSSTGLQRSTRSKTTSKKQTQLNIKSQHNMELIKDDTNEIDTTDSISARKSKESKKITSTRKNIARKGSIKNGDVVQESSINKNSRTANGKATGSFLETTPKSVLSRNISQGDRPSCSKNNKQPIAKDNNAVTDVYDFESSAELVVDLKGVKTPLKNDQRESSSTPSKSKRTRQIPKPKQLLVKEDEKKLDNLPQSKSRRKSLKRVTVKRDSPKDIEDEPKNSTPCISKGVRNTGENPPREDVNELNSLAPPRNKVTQKTLKQGTVEQTESALVPSASKRRISKRRAAKQYSAEDDDNNANKSTISTSKRRTLTRLTADQDSIPGEDKHQSDSVPSTSKTTRQMLTRKIVKRSPKEREEINPNNSLPSTSKGQQFEKKPAKQSSKLNSQKRDDTMVGTDSVLTTTGTTRKRRNVSPISQNNKRSKSNECDRGSRNPPRRAALKPKVMFTGILDNIAESIVTNLGGHLVTDINDCTHLVTEKMRRTIKFLCAVSIGVQIVTPQWLHKSSESKRFLPEEEFHVTDDKQTPNEEALQMKYSFNLQNTLKLVRESENRLFHNLTIFVTKSVVPKPQQMRQILESAGAVVLSKMPNLTNKGADPNFVIISTPSDNNRTLSNAIKCGCHIVSNEFVLTGVLRHQVDFTSFKLFGAESEMSVPKMSSENGDSPDTKRRRTRRK